MPLPPPKTPSWRSWTGMIYYGETVGFVAAWVAGIVVVAYAASNEPDASAPIDQVAAAEVAQPAR